MPDSCIACGNKRTKGGLIFFQFSKDPIRRTEWEQKIGRGWKSSKYSFLCEVHFSPEMWEKTRVDGTRKLKVNAVPTIFINNETERISSMAVDPSTSAGTLLTIPTSSHISSVSSEDMNSFVLLRTSKKQKLELYEKKNKRQKGTIQKYKNKLRNANRKIKNLEDKLKMQTPMEITLLKSCYNSDQITALKKKKEGKTTKFMKWDDDTITKSLKLKFACGGTGYEELLKQNLPYPSIRTLQRRLENIKFDSGILNEVFFLLKMKVEHLNQYERDCVLVLDEMAIEPRRTYDCSLNKYFGDVTLPNHSGIATHVLVFMLAGINTRWKQIVAYYFTGNSVDGAVYENIIQNIFLKTFEINLNIVSITSDMGPSNQALWRTLGISAGRHTSIKNHAPHPIDQSKQVFFIADIPHLFKNIKSMLITNKIIHIPEYIQNKYSLPTPIISVDHIYDLCNFQDNLQFKLAPKLTQSDLMPSHYDKMKVSKATHVISHDVSSALKFVAEHLNKPEYLTTAWFIDLVEKWFNLMTSRSPIIAISKFNEEHYTETIDFLNNFMEIIHCLEVGCKKIWKPCQTGALISTKSILDLQKKLLEEHQYEFILTSRFSQDCLENVFSVLRSKQITPNAMQIKNNLKLLSVSQFMRNTSKSSYSEDERELCSDFLEIAKNYPENMYDNVQIPEEVETTFIFNYSEMNSLYNIAGYLINSIIKTSKTCQNCITCVGNRNRLNMKFTRFTTIKCYKVNTLFFCHENIFYFFIEMESTFRKYYDIVVNQNIDLKKFYTDKMINYQVDIPDCHNLKKKIISRYIVFRLKISSKKEKQLQNKYASRSMRQ